MELEVPLVNLLMPESQPTGVNADVLVLYNFAFRLTLGVISGN